MKADDIRSLSEADVKTRIAELQEEQFRLRFRSATETLEQPLRLRSIRRDIARLLTVLRERELEAAPKATPKARRRANRRTTAATGKPAVTATSRKAAPRKAAPKAASRRAAAQ